MTKQIENLIEIASHSNNKTLIVIDAEQSFL